MEERWMESKFMDSSVYAMDQDILMLLTDLHDGTRYVF